MRKKNILFKLLIVITGFTFIFFASDGYMLAAKTRYAYFSVKRLAGSDRYETSSLICDYGWNNTSANVILTTGEDFPDSLCAAPLAAKLKAPILITNKDKLNEYTKAEIQKLNPENVYIIGGKGVISPLIENELKDMNIKTERIAGSNRYETSVMVAKLLGNPNEIFVTTGQNFPDALSIASVAAKKEAPIILSEKNEISDEFKEYLENNNITKSYVIGGKAIIDDNISSQLPDCTRIYGKNRYETNIDILNAFNDEFNFNNIFIATGENFPDALSGASLAALTSSPIILASAHEAEVTKNYFESINYFTNKVILLGGESVIPSYVIDYTTQDANAKNYLNLSTYDGSGQACHPKVLYFQNGWNGWKYWMTMTPYPNSDDLYENPSIMVSNSGTVWEVPKGIKNPVTPLPITNGQHNSDPHLVYNQDTNQLELWYRFTLYNKEDKIFRMTSSDGIHWSYPELLLYFNSNEECLSPAVIYENNTYKMWYVNKNHNCMYIESKDDGNSWSSPVEVNFNLPDSVVPWHLDMVHTNLGYEAVFCASKIDELLSYKKDLYTCTSDDGIHFGNPTIILSQSNEDNAWDNQQIYRSSFVKVDGIYKLFYSAMDKNFRWHIGLSQGYSLDDLHGYNGNINCN